MINNDFQVFLETICMNNVKDSKRRNEKSSLVETVKYIITSNKTLTILEESMSILFAQAMS